jgi:hypothetical protein
MAGELSLAQGAMGTENAYFDTATPPSGVAPTTLGSFACGTIINVSTGSAVTTGGLSCTGPSGGVGVTGVQTQVPITITALLTASSQLQRASSLYLAAFFGIPIFALVGWVGSRKSPRRNFFRFLGLIVLMVGISFVSSCGGSFNRSTTTTSTGIAAGAYLVQVVGKDQNSVKYYAVVPLVVNSH